MALRKAEPAVGKGIAGGLVSQAAVMERWGVPAGVLIGLRKRGQGPYCVKLDHQQPFSYARNEAEAIRNALLVLGKYGLALHGAAPLGPQGISRPDLPDDEFVSLEEAAERLGISKAMLTKWTRKRIGPRARRWSLHQPFRYRKRDVENLREALLILGEFEMALPNAKPLQH